MIVDTGQFAALRGEVSGLNEAVATLARRQAAGRREFRRELARLRGFLADKLDGIAAMLDGTFRGPAPRHAAPRARHLRLVQDGSR